jgi:hypothetical protein
MTKTQEKDAAVHEEWSRIHKELSDVIRAEFPVGTKVKFRHGLNWIYGTVAEMPSWDFGDELKIKNTKTGTFRNVKAKELEFDTDDSSEKAKKAA